MLFRSVTTRRKALKSPSEEYSRIVEVVSRSVAMFCVIVPLGLFCMLCCSHNCVLQVCHT